MRQKDPSLSINNECFFDIDWGRTCTLLFPWLQLRRRTCRWCFFFPASGKSRANLYSELFSFSSSIKSIKRDIMLWDFTVFILLDLVNREVSCLPYWKHYCQTRSEWIFLSLSSLHYYHPKLAIGYVLPLEMRSTISESVTQDVFLLLKDKSVLSWLTANTP